MTACDRLALNTLSALGVLVVLLVSLCGSARADNVAEALFQDGKRLMEAGKLDEACPKLAESHKREPGGGVVLALAICLEKQGKIASAWVRYQEAIAFAKKDHRQDRLDIAEPRAAALAPRVPRLRVTLSDAARSVAAVASLDGEPLPSAVAGTPLPIDPGPHVVSAKAPGRVPYSHEFVAKEGATLEIEVPALAAEPPTESPEPTRKRSDVAKPIGFVTLGLGVLSLGAGAFFGARAIQKQHDEERVCPSLRCEGTALLDAHTAWDDARSAARWSTIGIAVGVVATGVGAYLLLRPALGVEVRTALGPSGLSLTLGGAF